MIQKAFIRNELRYRYPELKDSIRALMQPVGRPLLFEGAAKAYGARVIVCNSAELNLLSGAGQSESLFLCIGAPKPELLAQYDICVLPSSEQVGNILNFLQRLFDRLDDWTESLRQAAEAAEGVEELLSRASEILQNPVLLLDARGHIVAHSEQGEGAVGMEPFPLDEIIHASGERVEKRGDPSTPEALYVQIQSGDARYTLLCTASERMLYASDEIVFESLAGFLRLMLSERKRNVDGRRKRRDNEGAASAFRSLLLQENEESATAQALSDIGWSESDAYAVVAIEPVDGDLRAAQVDFICDQLESALEGCCAFALPPVVVAIVRTDLLEGESLHATLQAISHANGLLMGVCEALAGYSCFPQRLVQAKRALDRAAEFGGVACYSDIIEDEMITCAQRAFPAALICMRPVLAMRLYDRAHDANYLKTAEQYVENHFNAVKTAGALFIHRSTLLYRLDRIKAQFGLDLDDQSLSLLHLALSIGIAKTL